MTLSPTGSKLHPHTHTVHPPENIVEVGIDAIVHSGLWRGLRRLVEEIINLEIGRQIPGHVIRTPEIYVGRSPHDVVGNGRVIDSRDRAIRLTLNVFPSVHTIAEPTLCERQAKIPG